MKKYKLVLFDLDGTLLNTSPGIFGCIRYAEEKMGLTPQSLEVLSRMVGPSAINSYQQYYGLDEAGATQALAYHREYQLAQGYREAEDYDGMRDLIAMLRESGYQLGVATLKRIDAAEMTLEAAGMLKDFDVVCGVSMAEEGTKAEIVTQALTTLNIPKEEAVLIGDSPQDAVGAKGAQVDFIAAEYGFGFTSLAEIESYEPLAIAYNVDDLIAFFDGLSE